MNTLIKKYSEEIGLSEEMTIENLIESHRNLRNLNKIRHNEWLEEFHKGYKKGFEQAENVVKNQNWISIEKLKEMSVTELVNFVNRYD